MVVAVFDGFGFCRLTGLCPVGTPAPVFPLRVILDGERAAGAAEPEGDGAILRLVLVFVMTGFERGALRCVAGDEAFDGRVFERAGRDGDGSEKLHVGWWWFRHLAVVAAAAHGALRRAGIDAHIAGT